MAITFDGANKLMMLSSGTAELNVSDIYSRWKDWVLLSDNSKYLPAFGPVGGDPIDAGTGTAIPFYDFLLNGWRVRPQEANHTLNVTGAVLLVDGGGDPFVNTLGAYTVRINYQQPVQAITVTSGAGVTAQDKTDIITGVITQAQATPIHADIRKVNNVPVDGTGTELDPWGPV